MIVTPPSFWDLPGARKLPLSRYIDQRLSDKQALTSTDDSLGPCWDLVATKLGGTCIVLRKNVMLMQMSQILFETNAHTLKNKNKNKNKLYRLAFEISVH